MNTTKDRHKAPRFVLSLDSKEQLERWRKAAERDGRSLAAWIRRACDLREDKTRTATLWQDKT